jgi:hypothetical protein
MRAESGSDWREGWVSSLERECAFASPVLEGNRDCGLAAGVGRGGGVVGSGRVGGVRAPSDAGRGWRVIVWGGGSGVECDEPLGWAGGMADGGLSGGGCGSGCGGGRGGGGRGG